MGAVSGAGEELATVGVGFAIALGGAGAEPFVGMDFSTPFVIGGAT